MPPEFAGLRDEHLAFIDTHTLRETAENRMAVAFTEHADPETRAWVMNMIISGDPDGYRHRAHATFTFDARDRLAEITVPTTIIHGELDATIPGGDRLQPHHAAAERGLAAADSIPPPAVRTARVG